MKVNPDFKERLAKAHGAHYARSGKRLKQNAIAKAVTKLLGRAVSQQKVASWFAGREPGYEELRALATVLETDIASLTGPPIEGQVARVDLLKLRPDPDAGDGVKLPQHPPQKPNRPVRGGRGGKHNRPVHKKPRP